LIREREKKMKRISLTLAVLIVGAVLLVGCTLKEEPKQYTKPEQTETIDPPDASGDISDKQANNLSGLISGDPFSEDEIRDMAKEEIECADSYITDVYSNVSLDEEGEFDKAEYKIFQGKDGTKYCAELKYEDSEYYFTLNNENEENILSLSTYAYYYGDVFEFIDLNMDGYADIKFLKEEGAMNSVYDFYLWDAHTMNFIKAECEDELLFTDMEVYDGYLQLWGRNSGSSGAITKYKWDGNKLARISEEEYHADDTAYSDTDAWCFTRDDIRINGKDILDITYEQLLRTFGKPVETKTFKINPPAAEPDHFEYIYVCVYDGFECEFYTGENEKIPEPEDIVFKFDITGEEAQLDCELFIGIDKDELDLRYGINKLYKLDDTESYDLNNIRNVLKSYKPEGYYSEYEKAAIVYHDVNGFEEPLAKALVLLFDDDSGYDTDRVERIVFGYPTAG
jgi:hypothetical protein